MPDPLQIIKPAIKWVIHGGNELTVDSKITFNPFTKAKLASTMKTLSVILGFVFATGIIQTAVGLQCGTGCAACWKDGQPGVDTKMLCSGGRCDDKCPEGYGDKHCAEDDRCVCHVPYCGQLGPCACGIGGDGLWKICKPCE